MKSDTFFSIKNMFMFGAGVLLVTVGTAGFVAIQTVNNMLSNKEDKMTEKTLHNSDVSGARVNVADLVVFGDGDTFKLLFKASSKKEGWMKSTKAMEIEGVGCVVQATTQQGDNVAEALTFVPGVKIQGDGEERKLVISSPSFN